MKTLGRYTTKDGRIPLPPDPAYVVIENGRPIFNLTADDIDVLINEFLVPTEKKSHVDIEIRRREQT
jgi:hypothetical protein